MTAPKPATPWQNTLPDQLPLHFRRNVTPGAGGCWLWTRSLSRDGYGWASMGGRLICKAKYEQSRRQLVSA